MESKKETEEFFPRGKRTTKPKIQSNDLMKYIPEDEQLFKSRKIKQPESDTADSLKIKKKSKKSINNNDEEYNVENLKKVVIENLTIDRLIENMIILGCIEEINEFELKFSIINGINIIVPITNISTPYSRLIENFANNINMDDNSEIVKLSTIFNVGEYYPVKILSKKILSNNNINRYKNYKIIGSINPKDIYNNFTINQLKTLPKGFNLIAAINSIEDHGYLLDIGFNNINIFLSNDQLIKQQNNNKLYIGQLIHCSLLNIINDNSFIVTIDKSIIKNFSINDEFEFNLNYFVPGIKTTAVITQIHQNYGLELELPGSYKGFVTKYHLNDIYQQSKNQFQIGQKLTNCYVLYVHPYTKQICISLKSLMTLKQIQNLQNQIQIGNMVEDAIVHSVNIDRKNVIFRLPNNFYAIALYKNLFDKTTNNDEYDNDENKIEKFYQPGTKHCCRIKKFNLFDNLIEISLRKSFIEYDDIKINDLKIGNIYDGIVKKYHKNGIYIKLGYGINGFIPMIHLLDIPNKLLSDNNRNNETMKIFYQKFFPLKKQLKCRIIRLQERKNSMNNIPKIILTAKKSLISLSMENLFINLQEINVKMSSTGIVCLINNNGILLEFFNNIHGFIPLKYLSNNYQIKYPEKVFYLGQSINCTVISIDYEQNRMICSLIDNQDDDDIIEEKKMKNLKNLKLNIGQIMNNMRIISKHDETQQMKGFDLINNNDNNQNNNRIKIFLPIYHLSDDYDLSQELFNSLNIDMILNNLMIYSIDYKLNLIIVTMKPLFLQKFSHQQNLLKNNNDLELNRLYPAIINNIIKNTIYFEIINTFYGCINRKFIQDLNYNNNVNKFDELYRGQSIIVTPIDRNINNNNDENDKENFLNYKFSMKLSDIFKNSKNMDDDDCSSNNIFMMKSYLKQINMMKYFYLNQNEEDEMKKLSLYSIGDIVTYTIVEINENFIRMNCNHNGNRNESTIIGVAFNTNKKENFYQISQMGLAIVCNIDFKQKCLILFIDNDKLIKQRKNFLQKNLSEDIFIKNKKIKLQQIVKGFVLYKNNKFLLIIFAGHLPGLIGFIPIKLHYNDLYKNRESFYKLNNSYQFIIKSIDNNDDKINVIATLYDSSMDRKNSNKSIENNKNKISNNNVDLNLKQNSISNNNNDKNEKICKFDWNVLDITKLTNKRKFVELNNDNDNENDDGKDFINDDDEEDDEDNEQDINDNDNDNDIKKLKRLKRNKLAIEREQLLREKEKNLLNLNERQLKNEQDFEMALISNPNDSYIWIEYMAYWIDNKEIDKARKIGERALKKISFREENEKLNIWISLLNLENKYGNNESMNNLINEAIKYNDYKKIYLHLIKIYENDKQWDNVNNAFAMLMKKYPNDLTIWTKYLLFYMKNNNIEMGRKLFLKSLQILDKKYHIDIMSKFAQFEFEYGNYENGKTIFEKLLSLYWERLDKWSIYLDMLIKYTIKTDDNNSDSIEFIRNVFERLLTFKFSSYKIRFILKKYYNFETKFKNNQDENVIERIQQKASELNIELFD